jgi:tRNA C32,U32 (ribose-2'-O)-methylase TrmJ
LTYELRVASQVDGGPGFESESPPATGDEMEHFYSHLERVLTDIQFLDPDNPRLLMRRMRRMFIRARPDKSEVNILRGFLSAVDRTREQE